MLIAQNATYHAHTWDIYLIATLDDPGTTLPVPFVHLKYVPPNMFFGGEPLLDYPKVMLLSFRRKETPGSQQKWWLGAAN